MKHHFCGRHTFLEWDIQYIEREKLEPKSLKLPLLHRHILDVSELLISAGIGRKCPHTAYGVIAYKLG